jgi:hypothetical protein
MVRRDERQSVEKGVRAMREFMMMAAAVALLATPMATQAGQCKPWNINGTWRIAETIHGTYRNSQGTSFRGEALSMDITVAEPDRITRTFVRYFMDGMDVRWQRESWFNDGRANVNRFCSVEIEYDRYGARCQLIGFMNRSCDIVLGNGYCEPYPGYAEPVAVDFSMVRRD